MDEDALFNQNGYKKLYKLCDTLQGELYKAEIINNKYDLHKHHVVIKKTDKTLLQQRITISDDGFNFCVSENIIKEALILQILTIHNCPIGNYIIKYIDFFESDSNYYLVMEYIESEMNLKQFINKAHQYINNGKLSIKSYQTSIKYLLWQLFVTITWLHQSLRCMYFVCTFL